MIVSSSVLKARPDVRYRLVGGKGLLIRQGVGEVVVLNGAGARILDLLLAGTSVEGVLDVMLREFEVGRAELERDATAFIEELIASAIVEEAPGA